LELSLRLKLLIRLKLGIEKLKEQCEFLHPSLKSKKKISLIVLTAT